MNHTKGPWKIEEGKDTYSGAFLILDPKEKIVCAQVPTDAKEGVV